MARAAAGPEIERLIQLLARLPGLGPRSARRAALHLVKKKEQLLDPLAASLAETRDTILTCETCGNIDTQSPCTLCRDQTRDRSMICVVEEVGDLWALERAAVINGLYHVLGGTLSPLDGVGPAQLGLDALGERFTNGGLEEVILATNPTVEGEATAQFISEMALEHGIRTTRIAHGVPMGGELEYIDSSTLSHAFSGRRDLS